MKTFKCIFSLVICLIFIICSFFTTKYIKDDRKVSETPSYKGVITIWHIDSFEGGKGSRKQFLLNVSKDFEKQNKGVFVMPISHTIESASSAMEKGEYPDLISYGLGVNLKNLRKLDFKDGLESAKLLDKIYAVAWCRGGYVLACKNKKGLDVQKDTLSSLVVSQAEYTQPIIALLLEGVKCEKIDTLKPLDAYVRFVNGEYDYFLCTQRDIVRLENRGVEVQTKSLGKFNDLIQYVSICTTDNNAWSYCNKFIEMLISKKYQNKLKDLSMMSVYQNLSYENSTLQAIQNSNNFLSLSIGTFAEQLKEMHSLSLKALAGEKSIEEIKKMLV